MHDPDQGETTPLVVRATRRPARRLQRLEWWLVITLAAALFVTVRLAFDQATAQRSADLDDHTAAASQPTVLPTSVPQPTPSIRYSFARLEQVAGGPVVTEPVGVIPGAPAVDAVSAILVDMGSRQVLYAKHPDQRRAMASTTKIVTAIVALEQGLLDTIIEVPPEAAAMEPNRMGLQTGDRLTLEALLYGLLLDSGNDAAEAIARGILGDRAQFIALMNRRVQTNGLQNTHFVNPAGFDDPDQYGTAYDLAVLATDALRNPVFRRIVGTRRREIAPSQEGGRSHSWFGPTNLNILLETYPGAFGVKPGWTGDAGYTFVAAAERNGRAILAVVLGSRGHFTDAAKLLDYGFATPEA